MTHKAKGPRKRQRVAYDDLGEHDRREVDLFEGFVRRRALLPGERVTEAYAAIYPEAVLFDASLKKGRR
jgi:hypothetical protein